MDRISTKLGFSLAYFIEWIKSDNIHDDQFYISQSREMLSEIGLKKGRSVDAGAVLITCIAGSVDHIGDTAITNRKVAFDQQINAITPFDDVNSFFLRSMLHIAKPYIQYNASAGMKHIITKSKLEELVLVKPPLSRQEEFAGMVARGESLPPSFHFGDASRPGRTSAFEPRESMRQEGATVANGLEGEEIDDRLKIFLFWSNPP